MLISERLNTLNSFKDEKIRNYEEIIRLQNIRIQQNNKSYSNKKRIKKLDEENRKISKRINLFKSEIEVIKEKIREVKNSNESEYEISNAIN